MAELRKMKAVHCPPNRGNSSIICRGQRARPIFPRLVVVTCLAEIGLLIAYKLANLVMLRETPGPRTWHQVLERFRFSDLFEGVAEDGPDEADDASHSAVGGNPVLHIVDELRLEDDLADLARQGRPRSVALRRSWPAPPPFSARAKASRKRVARAGKRRIWAAFVRLMDSSAASPVATQKRILECDLGDI
jgi:hypothetical protein